MSFTRSSPVTFFITRPPDFTASPRPLTKRTPMRLSRAAPAMIRRGPEMFAAATAADGRFALRAQERPVIDGLEGKLLTLLGETALDLRLSGVPLRAAITSSDGS